jgi:hypothetical protein
MVKNGGPNDAAPDDDDPVMRIHLPPAAKLARSDTVLNSPAVV